MLLGYGIATAVHGVEDNFDFWSPGDQGRFAHWLWQRLGRHSSLGWATEIEREAQQLDVPAIELFFTLLDEYRQECRPTEG
ncbi:hypothetical protein N4P33_10315 [Streptomyces sp. 15-116A]|uniref:hypothetical protein n=1 Tax=Streptomyces sp. 15-116A TaxID=2259035 RepID=UPI0021B39BB3|nr:hypothetical protein [Streptomyces sp. 15-116A]MCT7352566.1 hypothetical protein [Streptomyces sp. 15-116A]